MNDLNSDPNFGSLSPSFDGISANGGENSVGETYIDTIDPESREIFYLRWVEVEEDTEIRNMPESSESAGNTDSNVEYGQEQSFIGNDNQLPIEAASSNADEIPEQSMNLASLESCNKDLSSRGNQQDRKEYLAEYRKLNKVTNPSLRIRLLDIAWIIYCSDSHAVEMCCLDIRVEKLKIENQNSEKRRPLLENLQRELSELKVKIESCKVETNAPKKLKEDLLFGVEINERRINKWGRNEDDLALSKMSDQPCSQILNNSDSLGYDGEWGRYEDDLALSKMYDQPCSEILNNSDYLGYGGEAGTSRECESRMSEMHFPQEVGQDLINNHPRNNLCTQSQLEKVKEELVNVTNNLADVRETYDSLRDSNMPSEQKERERFAQKFPPSGEFMAPERRGMKRKRSTCS